MNDEAVRVEPRDHVLVITIDRPEARNAVTPSVAQGIERGLDQLETDPDLRVGVITGSSGYFSAGMDLKAFAAGERSVTDRGGFAGITERTTSKVLIAAIEGFALAGGLEIALACDLLVAARDSTLGLPEVGVGLVAAAGGLVRLPGRIPLCVAMEIAVTGKPIGADRAFALGLVNRVTDPGCALDVALDLARTIVANAPLAVDASKRAMYASHVWRQDEEWDLQHRMLTPVLESADALEGARAFAEKRAPIWRGR